MLFRIPTAGKDSYLLEHGVKSKARQVACCTNPNWSKLYDGISLAVRGVSNETGEYLSPSLFNRLHTYNSRVLFGKLSAGCTWTFFGFVSATRFNAYWNPMEVRKRVVLGVTSPMSW